MRYITSTDKEPLMEKIHGFTLTEIFDQAYLAQLGCTFERFSVHR